MAEFPATPQYCRHDRPTRGEVMTTTDTAQLADAFGAAQLAKA
jgi:hypothetical protein